MAGTPNFEKTEDGPESPLGWKIIREHGLNHGDCSVFLEKGLPS